MPRGKYRSITGANIPQNATSLDSKLNVSLADDEGFVVVLDVPPERSEGHDSLYQFTSLLGKRNLHNVHGAQDG